MCIIRWNRRILNIIITKLKKRNVRRMSSEWCVGYDDHWYLCCGITGTCAVVLREILWPVWQRWGVVGGGDMHHDTGARQQHTQKRSRYHSTTKIAIKMVSHGKNILRNFPHKIMEIRTVCVMLSGFLLVVKFYIEKSAADLYNNSNGTINLFIHWLTFEIWRSETTERKNRLSRIDIYRLYEMKYYEYI